jgi:hypothetical protein
MVNVPFFLVAYFLTMTGMHVLLVTAYRENYMGDMKRRWHPMRWVAYGIVAGIMLSVIALLTGFRDIESIVAIMSFSVIAGVLAQAYEKTAVQTVEHGSSYALLGVLALVAVLAPFVLLIAFILATRVYGGGVALGYVFGMLATILLWTVAVAGNSILIRRKRGKWATYAYGELWYIALTAVCLSLFAWEVFLAALRP